MILEKTRDVFTASNGSYGSPRITRQLRADGIKVTTKTVEHLMRASGLSAVQKRRFRPTTDSSKTLAPAPNLLQRAFAVKRTDQVWVSDFTELPCRNGKAYRGDHGPVLTEDLGCDCLLLDAGADVDQCPG